MENKYGYLIHNTLVQIYFPFRRSELCKISAISVFLSKNKRGFHEWDQIGCNILEFKYYPILYFAGLLLSIIFFIIKPVKVVGFPGAK